MKRNNYFFIYQVHNINNNNNNYNFEKQNKKTHLQFVIQAD